MKTVIISFRQDVQITGSQYIHAYVRSKGWENYLILQPDSGYGTDEEILKFIVKKNIQLVGISVMSHDFIRASVFAKQLKIAFPNIPLVFGGVHATIAAEECLDVGDIATQGEGEHTFLRLIECFSKNGDMTKIAGITYKSEGKIIKNNPDALEAELDIFPFPGHFPDAIYVVHGGKLVEMDARLFKQYARYSGAVYNITATRGCPFACTYCCNSAFKSLYGRYPVRSRSVENIIEELRQVKLKHPEIHMINFQDDCFLAAKEKWIAEFSGQYQQMIGIPFAVRTTHHFIAPEKLALLKNAGLVIVLMGLQSGSEKTNQEIYGRKVSTEDFLAATRMINGAGLVAFYDVIVDNPWESDAELEETINVVLQIPKPYQLVTYSLCIYQGTEMHRKAVAEGLVFNDPKKKNYYNMPSDPLVRLLRLAPGFPGSLIRFLINKRKSFLGRLAISALSFLNVIFIEPAIYIKMLYVAYGNSIYMVFKVGLQAIKTASNYVLRNSFGPKPNEE